MKHSSVELVGEIVGLENLELSDVVPHPSHSVPWCRIWWRKKWVEWIRLRFWFSDGFFFEKGRRMKDLVGDDGGVEERRFRCRSFLRWRDEEEDRSRCHGEEEDEESGPTKHHDLRKHWEVKMKWLKVYIRNLECSFLTIAEKGLSGKSSIDVGKKSLGVQLLTILIIGYWVGLGRLGLRRRSFMFYLINVFMKVKENPQLLGSSYWNIIHNLFIFDNDCCLTWAILLFAVKSFG